MKRLAFLWLISILFVPHAITACSLCNPLLKNQDTLGEEMERAKLVLFGRATASTLSTQAGATPGSGTTQFQIDRILKDDPFLVNKKTLLLERYVPVLNAKDPPRFLVFCEVAKDKLDVYLGRSVRSEAVVEYLEKAAKERKQGRVHALKYYFQNIDNADEVIAADAFLEFARASDQEINVARRLLSADKIRGMMQNPKTNPDFLGLLAFLLGGCGNERDAEFLRTMAGKSEQNWLKARDGLLAGYLSLKPGEGWELLHAHVADRKKAFPERFAAICALRFCYGLKLGDHRAGALRCLEAMLPDGEVADMAIEDLRQWQLWDLTNVVLDQYGKKSHAAPITKRTIIRYALCCPSPAAKQFVERVRGQDGELVREVAEGLQFEK